MSGAWPDAILMALRAHSRTSEEAGLCSDYITRNRHRMRYPQFRARLLCVSTGVVEAGCKHTVGARLKAYRHAAWGALPDAARGTTNAAAG